MSWHVGLGLAWSCHAAGPPPQLPLHDAPQLTRPGPTHKSLLRLTFMGR